MHGKKIERFTIDVILLYLCREWQRLQRALAVARMVKLAQNL